ncbi:hypothetical protein [Pantoea agglomerans]|uniref:hypothetical protein n=1 Tax=Enterobacter agglomerans TaxID=549 RepID=UPI0013BB88A8|nr:hypothetical protein [Pantoea agglomerans]NEG59761.1 hypothetical protein [Pantoea agglomerans]NEH00911.1 hypothetical protein [Pantoea agglomerans]NEH05299.1 hypothetical protein [Pantoea agglomerans]NEH16325.1 hypothetical protein [Pantoea agglomerans]
MMFTYSLKNKILSIIVFIFMIVFSTTIYISSRKQKIDCVSTFLIIPDDKSWEHFKGTMSVTIYSNGNGEVMFSGDAHQNGSNGKVFFYERLMRFKYEKADDINYTLHDVDVVKYKNDDLQDDLFSKYVYSSTSDKKDHLVILKLKNAFLMGNMNGPRHMCVRR